MSFYIKYVKWSFSTIHKSCCKRKSLPILKLFYNLRSVSLSSINCKYILSWGLKLGSKLNLSMKWNVSQGISIFYFTYSFSEQKRFKAVIFCSKPRFIILQTTLIQKKTFFPEFRFATRVKQSQTKWFQNVLKRDFNNY